MEILGFKITRKNSDQKKEKIENLSTKLTPEVDDGSALITLGSGGYFGQYIDISGDSIRNEHDMIIKYRLTAEQPECDAAVNDVINESISFLEDGQSVSLNMDAVDVSDSLKKEIRKEFNEILSLLDFNSNGAEIFRRWYIDGRLYYNIVIDKDEPKKGIVALNLIDSLKMRKVREIEKKKTKDGYFISEPKEEYFLYTENPGSDEQKGIKFSKDSICYVPSGLVDANRKSVISYLHKAIKPVNQLRMMEDSLVIYRLSRAPERRIFYIDVGNLPKGKADEYLHSIMNKYRNKLTYDANSGEIREDKKHMTMLEDFWLPRREGGRGTEITTLPGGCLAMDTKVSLLDGRELSIANIEQEMLNGKELWTYSCHPITGDIAPGLISWAGVTQKSAQVMKLTLDNGETITCTPDHKFPLYGKGFVRADELKENESLIPTKIQNSVLITSIEYLEKPIEVGTLTIDQDEKYHNFHTFALSAGVFTKNSSLGEIEDIIYFQRRLYRALNVPISRLESESQFSLGRATEINREEVKFQKFIDRLRKKFSILFLNLLKIQLRLKNIVNEENWKLFSNNISVDFITSSYFTELKNAEIMSERLRLVQDLDQLVGKYYSHEWIRRNVLMQTDEDIEILDKEIAAEKTDPRWKEDDLGGGFG